MREGSGTDGPRWRPDDAGGRRDRLSASEAVLLYTVVLVALVLVGARVQAWRLIPGILITEWVLVLAPVLLYLSAARIAPVPALGLRPPLARALVGGFLSGAAAWYLILVGLEPLMERILPVPKEVVSELERLAGGRPLGVEVLVLALTPAICEEVLFRGALLRGLMTRFGKGTAVALSAVLFGLFHLSIYRFVPTLVLGLILGYLAVVSRSLWTSVVFHFTNNGALLAVAHLGRGERRGEVAANLVAALAAAVVLAVGLFLAARGKSRREEGDPTHV